MIMQRIFILIFISFLTGCKINQPEITRDMNELTIKTKTGLVKLKVWSDAVIQVIHARDTKSPVRESLMVLKNPKQNTDWNFDQTDKQILLTTNKITLKYDIKTGKISFYDSKGNLKLKENGSELKETDSPEEKAFYIRQNFLPFRDEAIYGLGQHQDGIMNYRGHQVTLVQENRIAVVPVLVSSKNYGILWENYSKTKFSDDDSGMSLWSEVGDAIDYYFISGADMDEVVSGYRSLTGKVPMFAKWAYGFWQSKERYKTQNDIIRTVKEFRDRKVPLDVIVQDWQYWGKLGWNAMDFDRDIFPDPKEMLKEIHEMNVHYAISVWPRFDTITAVYKDMFANGCICNMKNGEKGTIYDAYNPAARKLYWKWLNKHLFSIGVDSWWMDATEPEFIGDTPDEIAENAKKLKDHAGGSWARYLNSYSLMTTKGVYDSQRKTTSQKRVCILTRSAYAGQQRYGSITWSGDIIATWDVIRKQISAGINFCYTGIPYWTTDIGAFIPNNALGCNDDAYRELYTRWYQFGAFCPIFRSHGTGTPREVWNFGEKGTWAYDTQVKFDKLRYRLMPYIYSMAWQVTAHDYTIMRGLSFDFNDDPKVHEIDNEYMFGPAFLVAPVTEKMYFDHTFIGNVIPSDNLFTANGKKEGLTTEFYNGQNFDTLVTKRVETKLDFDWNDGKSRPEKIHQHYYSMRFTGEVLADKGGEYTFVTTSNDGIRVWVNNQLIIDNWTDHGVTVNIGKISLQAGKKYPIKMEYYQTLGGAITKLAWIEPGEAKTQNEKKIPAAKPVSVYLPESPGWYNFWTGEFLNGGQDISTPAPIDIMPLFVKAGSIVPMGPHLQYADEKKEEPLEIRIYPGADAEFTLYEDENDNYNYEKGVYATILMKWDDKTRQLTIEKRRGEFPGMLKQRTFHIVLVDKNHGAGTESAPEPEKEVIYSGEKLVLQMKNSEV